MPAPHPPDSGWPITYLHDPAPQVRWAARVAWEAHLREMEAVRAPWPLHCPACGHAMHTRRWIGVLWLTCTHCYLKLGLSEPQERALAVAVRDPQPEPSAALLAAVALLRFRWRPVGY
jgi:ribosomal protein L37AE/L43A